MSLENHMTTKLALKNDQVDASHSIKTDEQVPFLVVHTTRAVAVTSDKARANTMADEKRMHMAAADALGLHRHWHTYDGTGITTSILSGRFTRL
ncbi:MAG: hypothetical protein VX223_12105 [Myxococcota bacterium]|nr:hypothetical protein [Myxococcota bacterium]